METKHTPGPWKFVSESACKEIDVFEIADISHLRVIHETEAWPKAGNPEDDARLIAAAPELLDALKAMVETWEHGGVDVYPIGQARDAIRKATE